MEVITQSSTMSTLELLAPQKTNHSCSVYIQIKFNTFAFAKKIVHLVDISILVMLENFLYVIWFVFCGARSSSVLIVEDCVMTSIYLACSRYRSVAGVTELSNIFCTSKFPICKYGLQVFICSSYFQLIYRRMKSNNLSRLFVYSVPVVCFM
jgi:hypothetical protein